MKTREESNITGTGARFMRLWGELSQKVFPFVMDEVGELDQDHKLFVAVCEAVIDTDEFNYAKWIGNGRPKIDRVCVFKAYILKMALNVANDKELVALLKQQPLSRRLCGWGSAGLVPSRPSFCRIFKEFAERGFTKKWFADYIMKYHGDIPTQTVSYDSAPSRRRGSSGSAGGTRQRRSRSFRSSVNGDARRIRRARPSSGKAARRMSGRRATAFRSRSCTPRPMCTTRRWQSRS